MPIAIGNDLLLTILSRLVVPVSFSSAGTYRYERSVKISLLSEPVESQPSLSIVGAKKKKRNFSDRKSLDAIDRFLLEATIRAPMLNNINMYPTVRTTRTRKRKETGKDGKRRKG